MLQKYAYLKFTTSFNEECMCIHANPRFIENNYVYYIKCKINCHHFYFACRIIYSDS